MKSLARVAGSDGGGEVVARENALFVTTIPQARKDPKNRTSTPWPLAARWAADHRTTAIIIGCFTALRIRPGM